MTPMTEPNARAVLASLQAGEGETLPTLAIFRAANLLWRDEAARDILMDGVLRRRDVDSLGLLPVQPKLSARMKAIAEGQPEPPTYPAPGMKSGFPECPRWPKYGCDFHAVQNAFPDLVAA